MRLSTFSAPLRRDPEHLECIHDNHNDDKMQSFKLLGVFLDEHVTLNKHVAHVTAKLTKALYLLRRV
jgi:hypothetical protein